MLKGAIALFIRQVLLIICGGLATAGVITATGYSHFCLDVRAVADWTASGLALIIGGGGAGVASFLWRSWSKARGGVT